VNTELSEYVITKQYHDDGSEPTTDYVRSNRYNASTNLVKPESTAVAKRVPAQVLPVQTTAYTLDVVTQSTQHIEMRTSAVDRAQGFLIANVPLFGAFALGVWLLSGLMTTSGFFTLTGLVILWLSFVAAWLASYYYTLQVSAEGIAMFEARKNGRSYNHTMIACGITTNAKRGANNEPKYIA
jgi:hypothetical protein